MTTNGYNNSEKAIFYLQKHELRKWSKFGLLEDTKPLLYGDAESDYDDALGIRQVNHGVAAICNVQNYYFNVDKSNNMLTAMCAPSRQREGLAAVTLSQHSPLVVRRFHLIGGNRVSGIPSLTSVNTLLFII
jgi:hypothetical protein